ncbi:hypothetical protein MRX96_028219 [Rhipicephalus microplus]
MSDKTPIEIDELGDQKDPNTSTSICHILDNLSRWNYILWHVCLQLQELRGPGKLSLHRCVESLHLHDTLIEGSELGECREFVISALEENTSLRTLTIGSLFYEYKCIREDLFVAISTMTHLREIVILGSSVAPPYLVDAICPLLEYTTHLITLSMPGIIVDEERPNGVSIFSQFLARSMQLTSLSVQGVRLNAEGTCADIERIVGPLVLRGELEKLQLTGFNLNTKCAALLTEVVTRIEGRLRSLDISGCRWCVPKSFRQGRPASQATSGEQPGNPVLREPRCLWLQAFDYTARVQLSFFALSMAGLRADDLHALFNVAITIESLQIISLRDVSRKNLAQVCQIIRESGMSSRVRLEDSYRVDSSTLAELREFPEVLRKIAISSVDHPSPRAFESTVHLACTWKQVTMLQLLLTQTVLSDVPTFHKLSKCLSSAVSLRALQLIGSNRPDLNVTLKSANPPRSVILDVISDNTTLRALRLSGFYLGDENLWFFVDEIVSSENLSEVSFVSCDPDENDSFIRLLAGEIHENKFLTTLRLRAPTDGVDEEWFHVEDVISRNTGFLTCAAHYGAGKDSSPRSQAAYGVLRQTPALRIKLEALRDEG